MGESESGSLRSAITEQTVDTTKRKYAKITEKFKYALYQASYGFIAAFFRIICEISAIRTEADRN